MSNYTTALDAHCAIEVAAKRPGLLRRALAALIASHEAKARRNADAFLATLGDDRLRELGFDPAVIRARGGRDAPFSVWS